MIGEIVRYQVPNKVLWAVPPPVDPAEQLLSRSNRCALFQLTSGCCSRLMTYRHCVRLADDPTCPDCHVTDNTVAHLFSCPTHHSDLASWNMLTEPLQVAQFLVGLPQFSDLPTLQVDFHSLPPKPSFLPKPSPLMATDGPLHLSPTLPFHLTSSHQWSGGQPTPLLSNTNNALQSFEELMHGIKTSWQKFSWI